MMCLDHPWLNQDSDNSLLRRSQDVSLIHSQDRIAALLPPFTSVLGHSLPNIPQTESRQRRRLE